MKNIYFLILIMGLFTNYSCKKEIYTNEEIEARKKVIDNYLNIKRTNEVYSFYAENEDQLKNCEYGYVNQDALTKTLNQLNYFRSFVGLSEVRMDSTFNKQCQAFILYARNNKDSQTVSPNGKCYSLEAKESWNTVISSSRYYTNFSSAVEHFIKQSDGNAVNRRWLLYPKLSNIGYGQLGNFFGIKVVGKGTESNNSIVPEFVAYPTKGFIMEEMMPITWTFMAPNADVRYSTVTLKMRDFTKAYNKSIKKIPFIDVSVKVDNSGQHTHTGSSLLGEDPSITFEIKDPKAIDDKYEEEDLEYEVSVKNVLINGVSKDFTYKVIVIKKA